MSTSVRLATILLTDLVGSTKLAADVGATRWDHVRDEHFLLLREAVGSSGGREVKSTGDGMMAAFESASAGVQCAVLMQQLIERRYRRMDPRLHVRIGLGAGESTMQDGDYYGMPTVEAARLCDKAPSDGILVSPAVRMLAGRCDGVEFKSMGRLELKGISDPVEAFVVAWRPLRDESEGEVDRRPLPVELQPVPRVSYVGRTSERARLDRARADVRSGSRRVLIVAGEPGVGKTRLAAYAAHAAYAEGFRVLWGGCSEDLAVPYEPWIEACSQLVEHADQSLLDEYVERFGGELGRLASNLARRVPNLPAPQPSDPDTERFLLFAAVVGILRVACDSCSVCLVLDDLHWGDGQTVALLKYVTRTVNSGALKLIVTYRDSELPQDHPLSPVLADLAQVEGVERIALKGLDVHEVTQFMRAAAGHELDQDAAALATEIARETGGNPFYVGEIHHSLVESGKLVFDEDRALWSVDRSTQIQMPQSVHDVIDRRVRRLGEEGPEVLTLAATIGHSFDVELLCELVDMSETRLLDRLESAVAASLLVESTERVGGFTFAHALINQSLYEKLGATRRARLHHRVAIALEALGAGEHDARLAELALHWRLAKTADPRKAALYARRAGQQALERLAPAEAVRLFNDAIEMTAGTDSPERCQALIGLGEAQRQSGDGEYRLTLLAASELAYTLNDQELAASAALANNSGSYSLVGEVDAERLQAIRRAIELDDPPVPARRARLLALEAQELEWDHDATRRRALADEALLLARRAGDAGAHAAVLHSAVLAYWSPETLALRAEFAEELASAADEAGDPALRFWAHHVSFNVMMEKADFDNTRAALEQMEVLASELSEPSLVSNAMWCRACWAMPRGEIAAVEPIVESAYRFSEQAGNPNGILVYGAQLAFLRAYQGRGEEVIATLEAGVAAYPRIPAWRAGLGAAYCLIGRHSEAAALVEDEARDRFEGLAHDASRASTLALYADVVSQIDDPRAAAVLYELIEPWSDQVACNGLMMYGHAQMWLALLASACGWHARADGHFTFAVEFQETGGVPLWAGYTHLRWAEVLLDRGDTVRARQEAARALELARRYGIGAFEGRAAAIAAG